MDLGQGHAQDGPARGAPVSTGQVVLVGADGSDGGRAALRAAGRLAARLGAIVVVGLVRPLPMAGATGEYVEALYEDLELEVLTQAAGVLDPLGVTWRLALATGDPATGLHQLGDDHDAVLVVVGTRGCGAGTALRRLVSGSVSTHLAHHERRPVLVVPAEAPAT